MKNRLIILFIFILGLFMPISSFKALETLPNNNIDQYLYYSVDNSDGVCSQIEKAVPGDLPTFGWNSSQEKYIVGANVKFFGINYQSNQEVYLKIYFYLSNKSVFQKDQLEYTFGDSNTSFTIYPTVNSTIDYSHKINSDNYSKSYSYKFVGDSVEIVQTLKIKSPVAGNGFRVSWGDCDVYHTFAINNVYGSLYQFGINSIEYQVLSDDNNVIIDQNNTIIDQNQQIIDEQKETQETIKNELNTCRDSYNLSLINNYSFSVNDFYYYNVKLMNNFKNNTIYTLSFDVVSDIEPFVLQIGYGNDIFSLSMNGIYYENQNNGHKKITFTTNNNSYSNLWLRIPRYNTPTTYTAEVNNIMLVEGSSEKDFEPVGEKFCKNKIDDTNDKLDNLNDTLNNDDVSGAESEASSFFENFTSDTFGLTSVITSPLNLIQSLTTKSCTPLTLPIPFVGGNFTLPCMSEIYSRYFGSFLQIYQIITFGIVSYYVCIRIFNLVKDFKNPEHDEIEVMDL